MAASYSASVRDFLNTDPGPLIARLALVDAQRFRHNEPQQIRAWTDTLAILTAALNSPAAAGNWQILLEFPIRRLGRRIDVVLVSPRAVFVLEFKIGATGFNHADRRQVEDYGLDLQDFHALSTARTIVPILVASDAPDADVALPLLLPGSLAQVIDCSAAALGRVLAQIWERLPADARPIEPGAWEQAPYRPVPNIIDAACTLYSNHSVAEIGSARADASNLAATTDAVLQAVARAERERCHIAVFVTGIPGAGKTLCGLNAVFGAGRDTGAAFLTGNPSLVHVLREALARDAARSETTPLRLARHRTKSSIQALPHFRDEYAQTTAPPPERVVVIDEAQRVWARAHAVRKSRDREIQLSDSEPWHLLDIMGRHDWAVVVCLIGNGQEIHDGEGGLAEWGTALEAHPHWHAIAAPATQAAADPRQRLPALPHLTIAASLHLDIPLRSLRNDAASDWVDAVLRGDDEGARDVMARHGSVPFQLTRSLAAMRRHLRGSCRGLRRSGLVASSGAKRLRADGLGAELDHMDQGLVARWFLDRYPEDVRASDALEQVATEFSCQGLELDYVGLCWGGDLVRVGTGGGAWQPRDFKGTRWTRPQRPDAIANRINTYRVLLTRARYGTLIWIPIGDREDRTRLPAELDAVADYLRTCGAKDVSSAPPMPPVPRPRQLQTALF